MNLKLYFSPFLLFCWVTVWCQPEAVIRVTPDPAKSDYRILFSSTEPYDVMVRLKSVTNDILFEEDFGSTNGFMQLYRLEDLSFGTYLWEVAYGSQVYTEKFQVRSDRKIPRGSIEVTKDELLNLTIKVASFNTWPINIFMFDLDGNQLEFRFWEPGDDDREMTINLSPYDAYEIRLEILQQGDVVFDEVFDSF